MVFQASFQKPFAKAFPQESEAVVTEDWWLSGGIDPSNAIAAYRSKGAASLAASYSNLANPGTFDISLGTAPTWNNTNGWIFNGSTQYLKTGVVPPLDTYSMIIGYSGLLFDASDHQTIIGSFNASGSGSTFLIQNVRNEIIMRSYHGTSDPFLAADNVPILESGTYSISAGNVYRNGLLEDNIITSGPASLYIELFIGALSFNGSPIQFANINVQSVAIYNIPIDIYVLDLSNAMNAL